MRTRVITILFAILVIGVAGQVVAQQQFFVAPLRAGVLGADLTDADKAFVVTSDGARSRGNEPAGSSERHYITTASTGYQSLDWTYEVTFQSSADAPDDVIFIGLGDGVPDGAFFNEPLRSVNFRIHQGLTAFDLDWRVDVVAHDEGFIGFPGSFSYWVIAGYLPGPAGGTHIARIRKIGNQMTFEILGTGVTATIADLAAAAPFLASSAGRLFFGNASSGYTFSDVRVLPETVGWCP